MQWLFPKCPLFAPLLLLTVTMLFSVVGEGGARQSELVNWYLKEIEADIESMQELTSKKQLAEKIVERLVNHVRMFISPL